MNRKIAIALTLLLFLSVSTVQLSQSPLASAQTATVSWSKTFRDYSPYGQSFVTGIVQTADGGYVVALSVYPDQSLNESGLLLKLDSKGKVEWNQKVGGPNQNPPAFLVQVKDGGYAVAGIVDYNATTPTGTKPVRLVWLAKTDSSGNTLWTKTYGDPYGVSEVRALIQSSDGGYAIAGDTDNSNSVGPHSPDPDIHGQFWLIKTDASGNIQWNKFIGDRSQGATDIIQTLDGGFALSGCIAPYSWNTVLVKTDIYGQIQWTYNETGRNADKVIQTSDGGYALAGVTDDTPVVAWISKIAVSINGAITSPTALPTALPTGTTSEPITQPTTVQKDGNAVNNADLSPNMWLPYAAAAVVALVCLTLGYLIGVRKTKPPPN